MEEKRTGGSKEFVFSVLWAALLLFAGEIIISELPEYKIAGVLVTIVMYCVLGYFVLTRYAAVYTLTLKNNRLDIVRSIGYRTKEVSVPLFAVRSVVKACPVTKAERQTMRNTVFSRKNLYYILYEKDGRETLLACDMSVKLADELKKESKKEIGI